MFLGQWPSVPGEFLGRDKVRTPGGGNPEEPGIGGEYLETQPSMGIAYMLGPRSHVGSGLGQKQKNQGLSRLSPQICVPVPLRTCFGLTLAFHPWSQGLPTLRPLCFCWKEVPTALMGQCWEDSK